METKFTIGNQVELKSGSPIMTVSKLNKNAGEFNGMVDCIWFDGMKQSGGSFHQDTLEIFEEKSLDLGDYF